MLVSCNQEVVRHLEAATENCNCWVDGEGSWRAARRARGWWNARNEPLGEGKHRAHRQGHLQGKDRHEEAGSSAEMSIVEMAAERVESNKRAKYKQ